MARKRLSVLLNLGSAARNLWRTARCHSGLRCALRNPNRAVTEGGWRGERSLIDPPLLSYDTPRSIHALSTPWLRRVPAPGSDTGLEADVPTRCVRSGRTTCAHPQRGRMEGRPGSGSSIWARTWAGGPNTKKAMNSIIVSGKPFPPPFRVGSRTKRRGAVLLKSSWPAETLMRQ
jgi:hypothetical protein